MDFATGVCAIDNRNGLVFLKLNFVPATNLTSKGQKPS